MIGRTLGIGAAGRVTFDVAAEDVRERTPSEKFDHARDALPVRRGVLERQSARQQKIA
jgi:hypothetical protein